MSAKPLILAFGNPVYDEIITPAGSVHGRVLSGCSTNACIALTQLGRQVELVGRIGPDFETMFRQDINRLKIAALTEPDTQTGGFRLIYNQRGERTLNVLGIAGQITQLPPDIGLASAIILGPIFQETPLTLVRAICAQSAAPLFLDPQGILRRMSADGHVEHYKPSDMAELASHCRLIKANEVEAMVLSGIDPRQDVGAATRAIRSLGCDIAIVTMAEAGSYIDDGQRQWRIPAYATEAADPTGAGDTYMAGFLHAYLEDPTDLYRAGCLGAAVASIWIESSGPDAPIYPAEVDRRLRSLLQHGV